MVSAQLATAQTLQQFAPAPPGKSHLTVFADGAVKQVVSQPGDATATTGSLGMSYQGQNFIVGGVISVLAKGDTITKGYGASLLPPAAGAATNSALLDVRWVTLSERFGANCTAPENTRSRWCALGAHGYLAASSNLWQVQPAVGTTPANVQNVPVHATGVGTYFVFFDDKLHDTPVGMSVDAMFVTRSIRGDVTLPSEVNDGIRNQLLGTTGKTFGGGSLGLNIHYDAVNAGLTYYRMAGTIPGFSGGQIVAAIALRAKLNDGDVK